MKRTAPLHLKTRLLSAAVALTLVISTTGCLQLSLEPAMQQALRDSDPKRRSPAMKVWVDGRELNSAENREAKDDRELNSTENREAKDESMESLSFCLAGSLGVGAAGGALAYLAIQSIEDSGVSSCYMNPFCIIAPVAMVAIGVGLPVAGLIIGHRDFCPSSSGDSDTTQSRPVSARLGRGAGEGG